MRIAGLERKPGGKRIDLQLDGRAAISLSPEVCLRFGLRVGDDLTEAALDALFEAETRERALAAALRLLAYRPRSVAELRTRLKQRAFAVDAIEETIGRLRRGGLLDDEQFARSWVESRERTSPRSRRLISSELRAKGVDARLAERSVAGADDEDAAYRAAARRAQSGRSLPHEEFRRRLGGFLLRRGFDYEVINRVVAKLWEEKGEGPAGEGTEGK